MDWFILIEVDAYTNQTREYFPNMIYDFQMRVNAWKNTEPVNFHSIDGTSAFIVLI